MGYLLTPIFCSTAGIDFLTWVRILLSRVSRCHFLAKLVKLFIYDIIIRAAIGRTDKCVSGSEGSDDGGFGGFEGSIDFVVFLDLE